MAATVRRELVVVAAIAMMMRPIVVGHGGGLPVLPDLGLATAVKLATRLAAHWGAARWMVGCLPLRRC